MQGQTLAYSVMYSQIFAEYIRHGHSTDLIHPVSLITACVSGGSAMCECVEPETTVALSVTKGVYREEGMQLVYVLIKLCIRDRIC